MEWINIKITKQYFGRVNVGKTNLTSLPWPRYFNEFQKKIQMDSKSTEGSTIINNKYVGIKIQM